MSVSSEQIAAEMGAKHWAQAEVMLNQVIVEHPTSARAWYYLAETQANEGKMGPAEASLTKYKALAPNDKHFSADPNAVAKLEAFIATPHPVANLATPHVTTTTVRQAPVYVAPRHHDSGVNALVSVLIIVAILACITGLIYGIVSLFRRRETVVYNNTYHDAGYATGSCPVGYGSVARPVSAPVMTATAVPPVGGGTVVVQQPVPVGMGPGYYGGGGGLTGGGLLTDMMAINMMENMMDHNHGGYGGGYGGGQVVNETIVNNPAPSYDPSPAPSYEPDYGTSSGGSDWGDSSFDSSDSFSSSDW